MNCHVLPPTIALSSGYPTSSCIATLSGVLHWLFTAVRTRPSSLSLGYRTLVWVLPVSLGPSPASQALPDLEAPSDPLCCQQVTAIPVEMFPIMASPDSLLASPDSFFPHRVELSAWKTLWSVDSSIHSQAKWTHKMKNSLWVSLSVCCHLLSLQTLPGYLCHGNYWAICLELI